MSEASLVLCIKSYLLKKQKQQHWMFVYMFFEDFRKVIDIVDIVYMSTYLYFEQLILQNKTAIKARGLSLRTPML